ncbi:RBBP9/YdeN family alpha/beta hydrolase [Caballeronia sordidicola]|nr:alpha/beta hydrolase [Caballeronia sordidicola]
MSSNSTSAWPSRLVTVPGLHGSEGAHWQTWLERQLPKSRRVMQDDWDAPQLDTWAQAVADTVSSVRGRVILAAHSFGCLAAAHAIAEGLTGDAVAGVLFVAPASPDKFRFAGTFEARKLNVPSVLIASQTDPWMPFDDALRLASQFGSALVNLGDAGHINTAAGFGPWPRAKYFVDTLIHCAAPSHFGEKKAVARDVFERFEQPAYG